MSIQNIAAIGEIIGSIAVVITLIYLAIQLRDNNRETRAATTQKVLDSEMFLVSQYVENSDTWEKVVSGAEFDNQAELREASNLFQLAILASESTFHQFRDGYIPKQVWEGRTELLHVLVRLPIYEFWKKSPGGVGRSADFLAFLDSLAKSSGIE